MKTVFVFAYYSFKDPVFQSAVLQYVERLSNNQLRFIVLTWEQKTFKLTAAEKKKIKLDLSSKNIKWISTNWHSGSFKMIKKLFDFSKGFFLSLYLIFRYRASKIYSEGFPGAIIGHFLSIISNRPHVVHTFEPHADYMKDSGVWTESDWEYRLIKKLEIPIARHASQIITATKLYKEILTKRGVKNIKIIPSCVDFSKLKFSHFNRIKIRKELRIKENQIVIVSMGKMGGMYMEEELFEFIKHCLSLNKELFKFILLTNAKEEQIYSHLSKYNISAESVFFKYAKKNEVPGYLSAADIAFSPVRPIPSQRYSSPIKHGEYWANGLPVLIPYGVSDDYVIVKKYNIGASFNNFHEISEDMLKEKAKIERNYVIEKTVTLRDINEYISDFKQIFYF